MATHSSILVWESHGQRGAWRATVGGGKESDVRTHIQPRGRGRLMWGKEGAGCVWCVSHSVVSDSFPPNGLEPARLLCPWDSLGKNTGVGCHHLSKRSYGPRNQVQKITEVSCIKGRFFTIWTTREAPGGTEEPRECHTILSLPLFFFFLVFEHFLKDFFDVDHY